MDLLFKRYANPFLLLDELILAGDFSEFINVLMNEREDELQWEYFLSRVYDKSFNEFKDDMKNTTENYEMSKYDIETTIQDSMSITMDFIPEERGGVTDGTI